MNIKLLADRGLRCALFSKIEKMGIMYVIAFTCLYILFATESLAQTKKVQTYYDDEKTILKERYSIKDSLNPVLHGLYESFFSDGSIQTRGYYKNNIPDSLWMYFYEKGGIKMSGNLNDGKNHGLWQFFFENGNLNMKGNIYGDTKEGEWKYYYENKQLKVEGRYDDNLKTGPWTYFNEDGTIKAKANYKNDKGIYREYYNDGRLKAVGLNVDGKSDSTWTYYYENGNIKAKGDYKEGLKNGWWFFYHDNGIKASEGEYANGEKEGKWIYYHETGKISSEGALRSGKKEGYWKIFDESGIFRADGVFEKGEGEYHEYYESGKLKIDGFIKDGKNHGQWNYYYEDGSLEGKCFFENGEGNYTGYYKDGSPYMKGKIKDGKNVGVWEFYNEQGNIAGYYRPFYEGDQPSYKLIEESSKNTEARSNRDYLKPDYKYKIKNFRYFTPTINEFQGIIIGTNPLSTIFGRLPLSIEYYFQERLGYEMEIAYLRDPFFKNESNIELNETYSNGFDVSIRQKFYSYEKKLGMFYFGHELRFTSLSHKSNVIDSLTSDEVNFELEIDANENRFEYAFMFGNRWMKRYGEKYIKNSRTGGITVDFNIGVGIGYRSYKKNYDPNQAYDQVFNDVKQNKFSLTPRITLNFGYVF